MTNLSSSRTTAFRESNLSKREKKSKEQEKLDKWFGMAKKEMTKDIENDLTILKLRRYLNPSSFVNRDQTKHLPKYFEVGREVVDGFNRNQKKAKGSIFERMVQMDEESGYTKKKFREIQTEKAKSVKNRRFIKLRRNLLKGQKKLNKKKKVV